MKQTGSLQWWALAVLLMAGAARAYAAEIQFASQWDQHWRHEVVSDYCHLSLALADYGTARFVGHSRQPLRFEMQARRDWQRHNLTVTRYAPEWLSDDKTVTVLGELTHIPRGGAIAATDVSQQMLLALRQGYALQLSGATVVAVPDDLSIRLHAIGLQPALDSFLDCAHTPVRVSWQQMSRTRVSFAVDKAELDAEDAQKLDALVSYVASDPGVTHLYVDGHTDSTGTERSNYHLSRRRAEVVAAHLRAHLADREIVVRYHGAAYPVSDNDTANGRAMNRRTTVRLEQGSPLALATKP